MKKSKDSKKTVARRPRAEAKQGFLEVTAHAIGSALGGMAVRAGIVKSSVTSEQKDKQAAAPAKATAKQSRRKKPPPMARKGTKEDPARRR